MYYGVEQSTDRSDRRTIIKKFRNKEKLLKWMENSGGFTYEDPESARNWHKTLRYGYHLKGAIDKKNFLFDAKGTNRHPITENDLIATYLDVYGTKIERE